MKKLYYGALAAITTLSWQVSALAQEQDPAAPIQFLKSAREKAAQSELSADKISDSGNKIAYIVAIVFSIIGIALAGNSLIKMYKANTDINSRESSGGAFLGFLIGSGMTILGVLIGIITYAITGT